MEEGPSYMEEEASSIENTCSFLILLASSSDFAIWYGCLEWRFQ